MIPQLNLRVTKMEVESKRLPLPPTMSNPSIIGTLPIQQSVDPHGSLCLHVPIKCPPAKLSPNISVVYHSAITEMSVLGVGWDLRAFGLIQRIGRTIAQDNIAGQLVCHVPATLCEHGM